MARCLNLHFTMFALAIFQRAGAIVQRPAATSVPGISAKQMPQMILFTVSFLMNVMYKLYEWMYNLEHSQLLFVFAAR